MFIPLPWCLGWGRSYHVTLPDPAGEGDTAGQPTKSILAVAPRNVARAEDFFRGMGIKIFNRSWYLGGFVGDRAAEDGWLAEKVQGWKEPAKTLSGVTHKHPRYDYTGLQKSLQQEWAFVRRVTPCTGDGFGPVEQLLSKIFIPALFQGLGEVTPR